jgi:cytochrome bd ubiquinol oxidase subunit II
VNAADLLLAVLFAALTAYALLGGADFGAGFWDLFAGAPERGRPQRDLIEHAIGPVWEANHVWLIFTTVLLWTGFPSAFAAIASTMYIPLTAAALGIIVRGSGFAFRHSVTSLRLQQLFGAGFALSSIVTPFFLGTVVGGVAAGRVPAGIAAGNVVTAWWNPASIVTGALAVGVCAYLAAAFLTRDAERHAPELVSGLRQRAMITGGVVGALAVVSLVVVAADTSIRFTRPLPAALVALSALAGLVSIVLLYGRRYGAVRLSAALAAAAVLWAWAAAAYPYVLPGALTIHDAAAQPAVLHATLGATVVGALVLAPSLWWLFRIAQPPVLKKGRSAQPPVLKKGRSAQPPVLKKEG